MLMSYLKLAIGIVIGTVIGSVAAAFIMSRFYERQSYRQYIYRRNMYELGILNSIVSNREIKPAIRLDLISDLIRSITNNYSMKHKLKADDAEILNRWEDVLNSCRSGMDAMYETDTEVASIFSVCVSDWLKTRNYLPMFEQMQIAHSLYSAYKILIYEREQELAKQSKAKKTTRNITPPAVPQEYKQSDAIAEGVQQSPITADELAIDSDESVGDAAYEPPAITLGGSTT